MDGVRYRNHVSCLALALAALGPLGAAEEPAKDQPAERSVTFLGALDVMPSLVWNAKPIVNNQYLNYDFQKSQMTTLTGSLVNTKLGLSLGFDAGVDGNSVNKAYKLGTTLGYKKLMLRVQSGSLQGSAKWSGTLAQGQTATMDFKNKYSNVDMLYFPKGPSKGDPLYFGLGYSTFEMPMQIDTLYTDSDKASQKNGVSTFDPNYKISAYSFLFGMDLMLGSIQGPTPESGFGFMLSTQDRAGVGRTDISDATKVAAGALNPGRTPKSPHNIAGLVDYDLTLGVRYSYAKGRTRATLGLGYNYGATMILNFTGGANNPTELGYEGDFTLQRHGPIIRGCISF